MYLDGQVSPMMIFTLTQLFVELETTVFVLQIFTKPEMQFYRQYITSPYQSPKLLSSSQNACRHCKRLGHC